MCVGKQTGQGQQLVILYSDVQTLIILTFLSINLFNSYAVDNVIGGLVISKLGN